MLMYKPTLGIVNEHVFRLVSRQFCKNSSLATNRHLWLSVLLSSTT
jgi:hypothetical protein